MESTEIKFTQSVQKQHRPVWVNKLPLDFHRSIGQAIEIFKIVGATYRHGTLYAPMQYLNEKEVTGVESSKNKISYSVQKSHRPGYGLTNYPVSCSAVVAPAMEIFEILGVLFTMVTCQHRCKVYIKRKATGVESPNMKFTSQCKNLCRPVRVNKLPLLMQGRIRASNEKFSEFWGNFLTWYRACTNAKFILKRNYLCGEPKNSISQAVQRPQRPARVNKLPCVLQRRIGKEIENFQNFGATYRHGIVLAPNAMYVLKGCYGCGEPKNAISQSV